jgi:mono/diheme cytochrome c family protein
MGSRDHRGLARLHSATDSCRRGGKRKFIEDSCSRGLGPMPAYMLEAEDADAVAAYLKSLP